MLPETSYTRSGSVNIAYQVFGDGPRDLLLVPGWISNIDVFWEEPTVVRFFEGLAQFSRVLLFDKRGTGLSDRISGIPTLEDRMDDVRAVMNAANSKEATLFGYSEGGPMCALFAATYPERTSALVLMGSYARRQSAPDYECGLTHENSEQLLEDIESDWGSPLDIERRIPSLADNQRFRRWWAKFMRAGASPASAAALTRMNFQIDVRPILPSIRVPTLILHARHDRIVDAEAGRYLSQHIPGARFIEFDTDDHVPFGDSMGQVLDETQQFVTGRTDLHSDDRVVSTIMFTDIVNSTRIAADMGDSTWSDSLDAHHATVRRELAIHRGTEVKTTGDGFHATFDGPARAIRCGQAICQAVEALGLEVRVGIHTGECIRRGDELEGIAVHIAARIGALANAGQVLVSRTVRDLVAGSGILFEDQGAHQLKGVDGEWSVCEATRNFAIREKSNK
jgi:pimeloyl-ACP methyl ester carboxylesterase/class 3 adenylate cyclase